MKKFDFIIQVLIAGFALVSILFLGNEGLGFAAVAQFFMGIWQILSSLITFAATHTKMDFQLKNLFYKYWIAVAVYFGLMITFNLVRMDIQIELLPVDLSVDDLFKYYLFIPPWGIALFYLFMTYKHIQYSKLAKSHSFLNI